MIFNKNNLYDPRLYDNDNTRNLKYHFDYSSEMLEYVWNNHFIWRFSDMEADKRRSAKITREQLLIILGFIIISYSSVGTWYMYSLLLIMYYSSKKITSNIGKEVNPIWKTKKTSLIIFWGTMIITLYSIWILIIKPEFIFMDTEILWDYGITITKTYSIEEKVVYFWKYFEVIAKPYCIQESFKYYKEIILNAHILNSITNETTLKEVTELIANLVGYIYCLEHQHFLGLKTIILEYYLEDQANYAMELWKEKTWYLGFIKDFIIMEVFTSKVFLFPSYIFLKSLTSFLEGVLLDIPISSLKNEILRKIIKETLPLLKHYQIIY